MKSVTGGKNEKVAANMQTIEDSYVQRGIREEKLRKALDNDVEYQKLLSERRVKLKKRFGVSKKEQRRYVLSTDQDYEILGKIHRLGRGRLSVEDRRIVSLIRTQLERDWRRPLMLALDILLRKYK
jgi:hypothetical protein